MFRSRTNRIEKTEAGNACLVEDTQIFMDIWTDIYGQYHNSMNIIFENPS